MAGEPEEMLPDDLQRWVDEQVAASDDDPADVLSRAVALYRLIEGHSTAAGEETTPVADIESELAGLTEQLSSLDGRVEAVEDDIEEKITDVRERVIQVKRETDAKAPADHDHGELREQLDEVEGRVDRGFGNYEEILSYLTDETDDLNEKLTRLAQVVVSLRRRTAQVEQQVARLNTAANIKLSANRRGITKAKCEDCGGSVSIGLLTEPACPHCESGFTGVEPAGRLFSSGTLVTGRPPALMAGDDPNGTVRNGQTGGETEADETLETVTDLFQESNDD